MAHSNPTCDLPTFEGTGEFMPSQSRPNGSGRRRPQVRDIKEFIFDDRQTKLLKN